MKISGNRMLSVRTFQHEGLPELEIFPHLIKDLLHLDNNHHDIITGRDGCRNISCLYRLTHFFINSNADIIGNLYEIRMAKTGEARIHKE